MLELPDVRMAGDYDCGPAAALCVLRYFGSRITIEAAHDALLANPIDGTDPRTLESFFRQRGLWVQAGEMDVGDLRHHTTSGRPVVCAVRGHWVIAAWVARGWIHYQDPDTGPGRKRLADWNAWWGDTDRMGPCYRHFGLAVWQPPG